MPRTHGLSKTRFTNGLQCHKQLWWRTHEPDARELERDESQRVFFDQGTRVGEVAREHVPNGVLIDRPYDDFEGRLADTQQAIEAGAQVIYEASFAADSVFAAVDILVRAPGGWRVIEVKSAASVKDQYLPDVAIQVHVVRQAGLQVTGVEIMVLNRACTYPDLSNLFVRHDVTAQVEELLAGLAVQVGVQLAMLGGPLPEVSIGPHCDRPYPCPFISRCWTAMPEHHVSTLFNIKQRRAQEFADLGYITIHDLPAGLGLSPAAERQRRAVQAGRVLVEGDLTAALGEFRGPVTFLDFETVSFAIPVWDGCHPYDSVPAQFSCHLERPGGGLEHVEWLPETPGDPREEIARRVVKACEGAGTVIVYSSFEKSCLESLAAAVPDQADALRNVIERLGDLLPVVRNHVYHPDFGGSFSIKSVLAALVPEMSYSDLEIQEGRLASWLLGELVSPTAEMSVDDLARRRDALLRYCERDTLAMVRVLGRLRELAEVA